MSTLWIAFIGGLVTFFSPCIVPVIPGYLRFMAGVDSEDVIHPRCRIFVNTLFFVIGFSLVFTVLGVFLSLVGGWISGVQKWMNWGGGILIIIFGLFMMRVVSIPFLSREIRIQGPLLNRRSLFTSFLMGAAFAIGWSPCVSAILASILVLATVLGSLQEGALLLMSFSVGLGVPFLLTSLFMEATRKFLRFSGRYLQPIMTIAGAILILLGILVFTNRFEILVHIFWS